jgi:hypothetical protein
MRLQNRQHVIDNAYTLLEVHRQRQGILAQTYLWIVLYYNCYGYAPTHDEIGRRFGVSGEAIFKRVNRLVALGFLRMPFGKHRGIELVDVGAA